MAQRAQENKSAKRRGLIKAARALFLQDGLRDATVDAIARRAGIAKGTFYLYFNDKYELMEQVALEFALELLDEAQEYAQREDSLLDGIERAIDYLLERFARRPRLMRLMECDFPWQLLRRQMDLDPNNPARRLLNACCAAPEMARIPREEVYRRLVLAAQLAGAAARGALLSGQPAPLDQLKPLIFDCVRKILSQAASSDGNAQLARD